jgi:aminopeptidase N
MKYLPGLLFLFSLTLSAQDHHARLESIDVQHYSFEIALSDSSDVIWCRARMDIKFKKEVSEFSLDLSGRRADGSGMYIDELKENGKELTYFHSGEKIQITHQGLQPGETRTYLISYHGVPSDGLIISKNKFGDRTFFGDNWPNRAHHWLPVVDHPSDKASVEFIVHAPSHYGVVANGSKLNEQKEKGWTTTHWKTTRPIPTKLMVIGVSPFAVEKQTSNSGVPVSSWVYPQNQKEGFYDYQIATGPLDFFEFYIAPFPYAKLANVQSKTVYGGMENASCIFYHEGSVTGMRNNEVLFAHEIAHQWFGDAVSELNWHHIWLSEGFATYLTNQYIEHTWGREAFVVSMLDEKEQVLSYARRRLAPIIDTTLPVSVRLLNKNSYEKGGWTLHMLRRELGDTLFQECIQAFYKEYKFGNALTNDFRRVVESHSGRSFEAFFKQWFYQSGHPVLSASWKKRGKKILVTVKQHQGQYIFKFPLDIRLINGKGKSFTETLSMDAPTQSFILHPGFKPAELILDPDTWLLFESYESP